MTKLSRRTRNRFSEHTLTVKPGHDQCTGVAHINEGRTSQLFECREHCDWMGWIPVDEFIALGIEENEKIAKARHLLSR